MLSRDLEKEWPLPAQEAGWTVAPGFEPVAEEFRRNFSEREELGAAFAAVIGDRTVVDVWGGLADRGAGRPWARDTLETIFSGTKGVVAICVLILIERGLLELDDPVRDYWPEFAAAGKSGVTVRQVVTHSAGLPALAEPVEMEEIVDDRRMAALLATQPQFDDPRAFRTYHSLTFGWLCGELVRRVDGRSIGRFVDEELAKPLGLDLFIGLPPELEARVAAIEMGESWLALPLTDPAVGEDDPLARAVWGNPPLFDPRRFPWNSRAFRSAEIPSGNGIATARSVAALYGALDQVLSAEVLELGSSVLEAREDGLWEEFERWGVGFELQSDLGTLGPPADAFGHSGAGGTVHGRWPGQGLGFSYVTNLMQFHEEGDRRAQPLLRALHRCVESQPGGAD